MTTIIIKNNKKDFTKTTFENSRELFEFLSESFGIKTAWTIPDEEISGNDKILIQQAQDVSWENLDNV